MYTIKVPNFIPMIINIPVNVFISMDKLLPVIRTNKIDYMDIENFRLPLSER